MNHVVGDQAGLRAAEPKKTFWKRLARSLAVIYLCALLAIWGCIHIHPQSWWPITLFLFSPRWAVAVPLLLLVPLTLIVQIRLSVIYSLHVAIIVFAISGYQVPWLEVPWLQIPRMHREDLHKPPVLRVLTCNLGGGAVNTKQLADLATSQDIHVLMLQECTWSVSEPLFQRLGWDYRQEANIVVGSCFELGELRVLARRSRAQYNALVAVSCDVQLPDGHPGRELDDGAQTESSRVHLVAVHLPTFREALEKSRKGYGMEAAFDSVGVQYADTVEQVKRQVDALNGPTVIAGDFNVPVESAYYRDYWAEYQNAFSQAGTGWGHTKFTRYHGVRIDHVIVDSNWTINSAAVAAGFGGDHRPVFVGLSLHR